MNDLSVLGHERTLEELSSLDAHSLLLVGPEGVGRRRAARWLAARLNCVAPGGRPCGECRSCLAFPAHPDYREVSPSLTTTTGRRNPRPEIRIGQLVPRPGEREEEPLSTWLERRPAFHARVGVIDGADRLTQSAANAFLKILEEPPSYARLMLIAPGSGSVLPTVASRCTVVRFGAVDTSRLGRGGHPAHRLGRPGPLLQPAEDFEILSQAVSTLLASLSGPLEDALAAADGLAKLWQERTPDGLGLSELLRDGLRGQPTALRVKADDLVLDCDEALARYSPAQLTLRVFILRLRELTREAP